jgi:hypothetical protein
MATNGEKWTIPVDRSFDAGLRCQYNPIGTHTECPTLQSKGNDTAAGGTHVILTAKEQAIQKYDGADEQGGEEKGGRIGDSMDFNFSRHFLRWEAVIE